MYLLYNLGLGIASLILIPWLVLRSLRGKFPGLAQRLGARLPNPINDGKPTVWIHAVSLGEVTSAAILINDSKKRIPGIRFFISSATHTGWNAAQRLVGPGDYAIFPPIDLPFVCRKFLRRIRPDALIVFETELWPNLFRQTKRAGCSLIVANGRISDRSFPRYRATRFLWRRVLSFPDAIFAQSTKDAERFRFLGVPVDRVKAIGNLKFAPQSKASSFVQELRTRIQDSGISQIIVAGSTMAGEEECVLAAFQEVRKEHPKVLAILAPRHPERFAEVRGKIESLGLPIQLRTEWKADSAPLSPGILLLDTMGELAAVYQLATIAFVGGTIVPAGGHNILEPASFGCPIVIGPHMENFQEISDAFLKDAGIGSFPISENIRVGSLVQVPDAERLTEAFQFLLRDRAAASRLGDAARALWNNNRNTTDMIIEEICKFLPTFPPSASSPAVVRGKEQGVSVVAGDLLKD